MIREFPVTADAVRPSRELSGEAHAASTTIESASATYNHAEGELQRTVYGYRKATTSSKAPSSPYAQAEILDSVRFRPR